MAAGGTQSDTIVRSRTLKPQLESPRPHLTGHWLGTEGELRALPRLCALTASGCGAVCWWPAFLQPGAGAAPPHETAGRRGAQAPPTPQSRVNSPRVRPRTVINRVLSRWLKTARGRELINNPLGFFLSWFGSS